MSNGKWVIYCTFLSGMLDLKLTLVIKLKTAVHYLQKAQNGGQLYEIIKKKVWLNTRIPLSNFFSSLWLKFYDGRGEQLTAFVALHLAYCMEPIYMCDLWNKERW